MIVKQPFISVITPVYNGADYLEELIISTLEQDYPYFEHIIIDDGSNDNGATVAILKKYPHLRWWSRENKGQYATLNEGLAAAKGEVITIICADDKYASPTVFSAVICFWQQHSDCGCVYGDTLRMNENSELVDFPPNLKKPPYSSWFIRHLLLISHCSLFAKKSVITEQNITFDLSFQYTSDWDWIIRLSQATKFAYFKQALSVYRLHTTQTSQKTGRKELLLEGRNIRKRHQVKELGYLFVIYPNRLVKAVWLLRKQGAFELYRYVKNWLGYQ